jgi:hypothetical protein
MSPFLLQASRMLGYMAHVIVFVAGATRVSLARCSCYTVPSPQALTMLQATTTCSSVTAAVVTFRAFADSGCYISCLRRSSSCRLQASASLTSTSASLTSLLPLENATRERRRPPLHAPCPPPSSFATCATRSTPVSTTLGAPLSP